MDLVNRAKRALQALGDIDRDALADVPNLSPDDLIAFGQRLWWITKRVSKAFEPVKARLRDIALAQANGSPGTQRLAAEDGSHALVVIPPGSVSVRKDTDLERLRAVLGDRFGTVFEVVTTIRPRKDFRDALAKLDPEQANAVMSVIDMTDSTPKVEFKD